MSAVIRIESLVAGGTTPFDGQYVAEYDPSRAGVSPEGFPMLCHLVTTPDIEKALQFEDGVAAAEAWKAVDSKQPVRGDGKPNRPLTAFTVEITKGPA
jgi:hypothetical protein